MNQSEIVRKMAELQSRKDAHLNEYSKYINMLAEENSSNIFFSGYCNECDSIEREIKDLAKQLLK